MARILIISSIFPPEPVVSALLSKDIAEALSLKHEVVVLCPEPSRPQGFVFNKKIEPSNYRIRYLGSFICPSSNLFGRFRESYSFGNHCSQYIKANSAHISSIYINSWPLLSQYAIIKTAKKFHIPTVIHIQDIYPESLSNKLPSFLGKILNMALRPLDQYILENASSIIGISPDMISYLSKNRNIKKGKFELVRNWQDDENFLSVPNKNNDLVFTFMYVGSISPSAGVDLLISAFHRANLRSSELLIVGNGSEKDNCLQLANKLDNHNIKFLEVVPADVPEIQSKADVLLLPLRKGISKTATPSKLTAYLFSAKPVIACVEEESDVADILNVANCGFVVEPENTALLAEQMRKVSEMNPSELLEMGASGRKYAEEYLSKEKNLEKVVNIIENCIHEN